MELVVHNFEGKPTSKKINLDDEIFKIKPNDHSVYLDVKQILANKRQGTHKSKQRSEITGSTRKIKKQKGTGTARAGSIKSPLFIGGGTAFGPTPRDYSFKLNKKLKVLARKSALSLKNKSNDIILLEDLNFETSKTRNCNQLLNNLNISEKKTLLLLKEKNKSVYLSARNLKNIKVLNSKDINTYDIMNASKLLICEGALENINKIMK